ncbi:AAA-ATPase At2g18193-like [Pyrus x bretschneideri]|uniref:AAA-ATPase At2g18193-like n=1 Tax=Pyrus x bretschneideri TaxID=225117 RepID=UPI002030A84D|nr:AAA-ATPase At2g18193-like [Pyrus x bretschneideri]
MAASNGNSSGYLTLFPQPLRSYIFSKLSSLFSTPFSSITLVIEEFSGAARNQVYATAEVYLRTINNIAPSTHRFRVGKNIRQKNVSLALDNNGQLEDAFDNVNLTWRFKVRKEKSGVEQRQFELSFHKKHKDKVMESYFPYVLARADAIKEEQRVVQLYFRHLMSDIDFKGRCTWGSVNLEHPSTFDTMVMDPETKKMIVEDLERFVRRREFYKKVGKAWKRGYLLYGPPGTGKSSLIMVNYLKFDVYDLELTSIQNNNELRRILLSTTNRSILVIEDIDCSVDMQNRESNKRSQDISQRSTSNKLTLSGLLNFTDGLWSSCGDERIIVFTTNHKDQLDPALLRPGRMDLHIYMSYCTAAGFRILASNYLGIQENNRHRLCGEIEALIESTEITPAEVAEELMKNDDPNVALQRLVNLLK